MHKGATSGGTTTPRHEAASSVRHLKRLKQSASAKPGRGRSGGSSAGRERVAFFRSASAGCSAPPTVREVTATLVCQEDEGRGWRATPSRSPVSSPLQCLLSAQPPLCFLSGAFAVQPPLCTLCPAANAFLLAALSQFVVLPFSVGAHSRPVSPAQRGPALPVTCLHARAYLSPTTADLHLYPSLFPTVSHCLLAPPPLSAVSLVCTAYSPPCWQKPHTDRSTRHRLNLTSTTTTPPPPLRLDRRPTTTTTSPVGQPPQG